MYAIVKTGGKQLKVCPGDIVRIDKIDGDVGNEVIFKDVLMVVDPDNNTHVGKPILEDAKILGQIIKHPKGNKIIIFKFKRRKGYKKKTGHRQLFTEVKINEILV
jgi:large subunit ribosomal protein L21